MISAVSLCSVISGCFFRASANASNFGIKCAAANAIRFCKPVLFSITGSSFSSVYIWRMNFSPLSFSCAKESHSLLIHSFEPLFNLSFCASVWYFSNCRLSAASLKENISSSNCWVNTSLAPANRSARDPLCVRDCWPLDTFSLLRIAEEGILESSTIPARLVHLLSATYTCPLLNAAAASIIKFSKVSPWLLCMVMAHARRKGYCVNVPTTSCCSLPSVRLRV